MCDDCRLAVFKTAGRQPASLSTIQMLRLLSLLSLLRPVRERPTTSAPSESQMRAADALFTLSRIIMSTIFSFLYFISSRHKSCFLIVIVNVLCTCVHFYFTHDHFMFRILFFVNLSSLVCIYLFIGFCFVNCVIFIAVSPASAYVSATQYSRVSI